MNSLDIKQLLPELKKQVMLLAEDLLKRVKTDANINDGLKEAFKQIEKGGRTAQAYEIWLEDYLDQVAVAWVLACVFIRFMEDNGLIDECWLAGEGERRALAEDARTLYFREHPHESDREYFEHVFHEVGKIPAATDLFAEGKTPLWAVAPSGDAAMNLLKFWREMNPEAGTLKRPFKVESGDTRFLGDLYQELSEKAKKKYALLQTPVFVEEFILDRTLTPAIGEFGLEKVRMIDPTCGSGHFLLGGFARLFNLWSRPEHTSVNAEKDAQKAFDGIWGVDINPFAVAIARFRLIVAAVQACGIKRLKQAPGWNIHLATGDSLLFGKRFGVAGHTQKMLRPVDESKADNSTAAEEFWAPDIYACEEKQAVHEILGQQYHAVVGNPPYIIVRDRKLNSIYRERYSTCHQKYSLAVPFAERFFELCYSTGNDACGYVGQITSNSFMKREFGKKLIEAFFPTVDLTHVIDTSGAYIPGHGTPTVILLGRNRKPSGNTVRAVLGIKGEATAPEDASQGFVWQSIVHNIDTANAQNAYTSTTDIARSHFNSHPWSIGGGGAAELKELVEAACQTTVEREVSSIGFASFPGLDDAFAMDGMSLARLRIEPVVIKDFVYGELVNDWHVESGLRALAPYDSSFNLIKLDRDAQWAKYLWCFRVCLEGVVSFGGRTRKECGDEWWGWYRWIAEKYRTPLSIVYREITTHNHFILDRGGKVFKHSVQNIKLRSDASEETHFELLGLLNSSVACFWLKQNCHDKGGGGIGGGLATEFWEHFFDFTGSKIQHFPVPLKMPTQIPRQLDTLGEKYSRLLPQRCVLSSTPVPGVLSDCRTQANSLLGQMIALQEELDWQCYQLYGLLPDDLQYTNDDIPELALGQRSFEILMARQMANSELETTWFERHGSKPIIEIPTHWPDAYRKLVQRRIDVIESNNEIALIEKPEYKRRWNAEPWEEQEQRALKNWLLDLLETLKYRKGTKDIPELTTTAQMADIAGADEDFVQVAALFRGRHDFDVSALVAELVESEAVPFLPVLRYKPAGLRKREIWERTWALQRQQDAGKDSDEIPVPPKYATSDFLTAVFWRLRGKLDVPKERWISYPFCSTDSDQSLVVGWAGWNHLEHATALAAYYDAHKRAGWTSERLKPLLAGLDQLVPWIHQWHPEVDPEYGETAGQSFQHMLESDTHELGLTLDDVRNWTPPVKQTKASKKKAKEKQTQ